MPALVSGEGRERGEARSPLPTTLRPSPTCMSFISPIAAVPDPSSTKSLSLLCGNSLVAAADGWRTFQAQGRVAAAKSGLAYPCGLGFCLLAAGRQGRATTRLDSSPPRKKIVTHVDPAPPHSTY